MLSENHHFVYWLSAISARILYEVLSVFGWRYTAVGALLMLGAVERLILHWKPPIPVRHKILLSRDWGRLPYYELMGCALVSLGALVDVAMYRDIVAPAVALGHSRAVHILLAFSLLGVVEPVRQNVCCCNSFIVSDITWPPLLTITCSVENRHRALFPSTATHPVCVP